MLAAKKSAQIWIQHKISAK